MFRKLPLPLRLIASIAAALLLTAGLSVIPIYWHAKSKVATEMEAALGVGAQVATHEIETRRTDQNLQQRLRLLVAHFNGDRHLKTKLLGRDGRVLTQSQLAPPDETAPQWFSNFLQARQLSTTLALPTPAEDVQAVVIEANPTNEIAEAWDDLKTFTGILGLFSLLALAFVSWIVTRAIEPIRSLLLGYDSIASGELDARVAPAGSPELRALCHGFNDMGDALSQMVSRNERLQRQVEEVQDEERADLARDLHDEVSPLLFAADVDAAMIEKIAKSNDLSSVNAHTHAIREALRHLKRTVTLILGRLRPAVLLDQGLSAAIDNLITNHTRTHPNVKFKTQIDDVETTPATLHAVFFVAREAIANALRHGAPSNVHISVTSIQENLLNLIVSDDGNGMLETGARPGFGTQNMKDRVARCDGKLTIQNNRDGKGVRVEATLPLGSPTATKHLVTDAGYPQSQVSKLKTVSPHS